MASINSIYGSSTNKGVGGLLSGLDTDELVEKMTLATRTKINRQYQSRQKLLYRQEAYREISSKLLAFSDKYFSYSSGSKTNILSASFFEAYTYKPSSDYVKITGNAEDIKNFSIKEIKSVASEATLSSSRRISNNKLESSDMLSYLASPLAGERITLEIDGETHTIEISKDFGKNKNLKVSDVVDEINKQLNSIEDEEGNKLVSFRFKEGIDGDGNPNATIVFADETKTAKLISASNTVTGLLNMKVGENAKSTEAITSELNKSAESVLKNTSEYITFNFNGVKKQIYLDEDITNHSDLVAHLQEKLNSAYGKQENGDNKINVSVDSNGKLSFGVEGKTNILNIDGISSDLSQLTGISAGKNSRISLSTTLADSGLLDPDDKVGEKYLIEINGETLGFDESATLSDVIKAINSNADMKVNINYSSTSDTFSIMAKETGSHINLGDVGGALGNALFGDASDRVYKEGTDTEMTYTLNGRDEDIIRSTNNFTIDGMTIELNKSAGGFKANVPSDPDFDFDAPTVSPITFGVTNNVDEVVERVKKFIDEYNDIITSIGSKTKEKPNSKYPPLTPDQQEEMKEKEIENWNKEAKKGILFGDSKMGAVLSDFRMSMMGKTDVSDFVLANIGISPAFMDTSGKLVLDEKKFKEALMENPDEIASLFTGTKEGGTPGLAVQLKEVLNKNIGAFGTSGVLIEEAGLDSGRTSDQNNISERIKDYDDKMEALKKALEKERQRYWNQFTALEKALSQLNSQSSWLTDMMG